MLFRIALAILAMVALVGSSSMDSEESLWLNLDNWTELETTTLDGVELTTWWPVDGVDVSTKPSRNLERVTVRRTTTTKPTTTPATTTTAKATTTERTNLRNSKTKSTSALDVKTTTPKTSKTTQSAIHEPQTTQNAGGLMDFLKRRKQERFLASTTIDPFIAILATATPVESEQNDEPISSLA